MNDQQDAACLARHLSSELLRFLDRTYFNKLVFAKQDDKLGVKDLVALYALYFVKLRHPGMESVVMPSKFDELSKQDQLMGSAALLCFSAMLQDEAFLCDSSAKKTLVEGKALSLEECMRTLFDELHARLSVPLPCESAMGLIMSVERLLPILVAPPFFLGLWRLPFFSGCGGLPFFLGGMQSFG